MKLLFVHDHKFRRCKNVFYSTGALDHMALERYVKVFEKITILARIIDDEDCSKYSKIMHSNITILDIRNLTQSQIKKYIETAEKMIVRLPSFYGMLAIHYNLKINTPYLVEMVGCPWDELWNYKIKTKFIAPIITLIDKKYVYNAPYVIYVTNRFLQSRYPTKGKNMACSNVTLVPSESEILEKRIEKIRNHKGRFIIGTTAAIDVKYKGQEYVIKAISLLKKQGIDLFQYQIVGNGNPDYLRRVSRAQNVEDKIEILGGIPHEKVFQWLDNIDIYIQPSRQEGLPRALIEAMSRGLPAIGSNTAGIPELLDEHYTYNHSIHEEKRIAKLLLKIIVNMEQQCNINFLESKKYNNVILEKKRYTFLKEFRKGC